MQNLFGFAEREYFGRSQQYEPRAMQNLFGFAEREYFGRSQQYEP